MIRTTILLFVLTVGINSYFDNCSEDKPEFKQPIKYKGKYQNGEQRAVEMIDSNYDKKHPKKN